MGNMFKCVLASGTGNGIPLIVSCTSAFAGLTITCTDGTTTLTDTCPSSSPYEITFNLPNTGTWIVSGTISGQTFTTTITVTDETALLSDIPDGATVTPTNDVQILLNCANIWDKAYTTISQLLADTTSLLAVISDNNAVDYLVRSTTFASAVCADSTAMTYIGADDYCADTLLADSTWLNAICNSTYFESVLNVKVPTMTSDTAPSGVVFSNPTITGSYKAFHAFDSDDSNFAVVPSRTSGYIGYKFTRNVKVYKVYVKNRSASGITYPKSYYIQGSNNGTNFTQFDSFDVTQSQGGTTTKITNSLNAYQYIAIKVNDPGSIPSSDNNFQATKIQFWGRATT